MRSYDHPDAVALTAAVQQEYVARYGGVDATPTGPDEFAPPAGLFLVGYAGRVAVACGGWRARDGATVAGPAGGPCAGVDAALRAGDAEIKRMYVAQAHRRRGYARALLAELERTAGAAGRLRIVLETGTRQPEAIALYTDAGYAPIAGFGVYRDAPGSRYFAKPLPPAARPAAEATLTGTPGGP